MKEIELKNKRKPREKHFLQEDGTIRAEIYDDDIHFKKNGQYEEIDNTLVEKTGYFTNKNNSYKVHFSKNSRHDLMTMESQGHYITILLKNNKNSHLMCSKAKESKFIKTIKYEDILEGINFEYKVLPTKIKEGIIIKEKKYSKKVIDFVIETDLDLRLNNDKTISAMFVDKEIFKIDAPYMMDNDDNMNNNIIYNLFKDGDEYNLSLHLDYDWLMSEDRKYPIMIDPTISNSIQDNNVIDTYIYPGDTNVERYNQAVLKAGVERIDNNDVVNRALLKFNLPTIGTGSEIISAIVNLIGFPVYGTGNSDYSITAHRITTDWNEQTANWNNMNNNYESKASGCTRSMRSYLHDNGTISLLGTVKIDITSLVKKWYLDTPNYGIMIKSFNEVYIDDKFPAFFSKNNIVTDYDPKPLLVINYRNQNGLEDYLTYSQQTFSEGSAYVNNYNGNLTTAFDIGVTKEGKFPAKLNLIYNTNDFVLNNNIGYGLGYKLNFHQTIRQVNIDEKDYLELCDDNGTLHYFKEKTELIINDDYTTTIVNPTPGYYYDEDGLDLSIKVESDKYILKDKNNTEMIFSIVDNVGYLTKILKVDNQEINVFYNTSNLISRIVTDNDEMNITYLQNVIKVNTSDEEVILSFNSNKLLTQISKIRGQTTFEYNSLNLLEKINDSNGIITKYQYYDITPYKIKKVTEYNSDLVEGKSITFVYNFKSTNLIDNTGKTTTLLFNDAGNVVSASNLKNGDSLKNAYGKTNVFGDENEINKLWATGIPIAYVNNLLSDSSFENQPSSFVDEDGIVSEISTDYSKSGTKSLKITNNIQSKCVKKEVNVLKGEYYTFSCYVKNDNNAHLAISYIDATNNLVEVEGELIHNQDDFDRYDVSIYYPETALSNLSIKIYLETIGIAYIDDLQLETGEVANNYNFIENSNFSSGTNNWDLDFGINPPYESLNQNISNSDLFEVVDVGDGVNALKVKMRPDIGTSVDKTINISGKAGDLLTVSFWYKNEGTNDDTLFSYNNVVINYDYVEEQLGRCSVLSDKLNPNNDDWQFFSYSFVPDADYKKIYLRIFQSDMVNDLYITNISLFKDIRENYYSYDENGNIKGITSLTGKKSEMSYNKNNQIINIKNPTGAKVYFEYDKLDSSKLINTFANGEVVENKYDYKGNFILSRNKFIGNSGNFNGLFKIRQKGTTKYLKNNSLNFSNSNCVHDCWNIEKVGDYYKISTAILRNKSIANINNNLVITTYQNDNSLFEFIKNEKDESYSIKAKTSELYLKQFNNSLVLSELDNNDDNFNFYIEDFSYDNFIEINSVYDENDFLSNVTDSLLNKTTYDTDSVTGLLSKVTNANGNVVDYVYDEKYNLISLRQSDKQVDFVYNNNNVLQKIRTYNKEYNIIYDDFYNVTEIKVGDSNILVRNTYEDNNGNLSSTIYGNDDIIRYEYDDFNRIKRVITSTDNYDYLYNNNGDLVKIKASDSLIKYEYDSAKRLHKYLDNGLKIKYAYDNNDNLSEKKIYLNDILINDILYNYDSQNDITSVSINGINISYEYDNLGRLKKYKINNNDSVACTYIKNGKRETTNVKEYNNFKNLYRYKYDKLNNVTHIYENDILSKKYYYDVYNQLIKEKDYSSNTLKFFDYDNDGNIISKRTYDLTSFNLLSKLNYEYDDDSWKDKLTKINDKNIVYDNSGNPISIGNDITLNWVNGKQLIQYSDSNNIINYEYNVFGLRKSKSVNGFKTEYKYDDTKLIYEKNNINEIYYYYDVFDSIIGFKLNNTSYYYLKNKFNDVVGILDENNSILYEYEYDAWGNILKIVDSFGNDVSNSNCIANINPFRYRSYYYDVETKMYYLNSRYYNPEWSRFINSDSFIAVSNNISTYNLFSYAFNNPLTYDDYSGSLSKKLKNFLKKAKKRVVKAATAAKKFVTSYVNKIITKVKNLVTGKTSVVSGTTKNSRKTNVYKQSDFIVDSSVNVTRSTTSGNTNGAIVINHETTNNIEHDFDVTRKGLIYNHTYKFGDDIYLRRETDSGSFIDFGFNTGVSISNLSYLVQGDFTIHHSNGEDTTYDVRFDFKLMDVLLAGAVVLGAGIVIVGGASMVAAGGLGAGTVGAIGAATALATAIS